MKCTKPLKISDTDIIRRTVEIPISIKALMRYTSDEAERRSFTLASLASAHCQMNIYDLSKWHGITFKALVQQVAIVLRMGPRSTRKYLRRLIAKGYLAVDRPAVRKGAA